MRQLFDKEKVTESIARLKSHGGVFELVIDPEGALKFRRGEGGIRDALKAPHIYKSVQTGELAGEESLLEAFKTTDEDKAAEKIILDGELHFNDEYKENLRSEKKAQILAILSREAALASTGEPVSEKRLQAAFTQAKVNVDLYKKVEEQIPEIISKLRVALPLTLERKTLQLRLPARHAPRLYGFVSGRSRIIQEAWLGDGSLSARVELPAGSVSGFIDELKKSTHGDAEINIETQKKR